MKRIFCCLLVIFLMFSISGCKKKEPEKEQFSAIDNSTTASNQTETTNNFANVAGIWQITESTLDGKKIDVKKYKDILTYLYNDGTVKVDGGKAKDTTGTYTFNGTVIITKINDKTSVMTVSDDYSVMTATGMNNGKKIVTTYTKIAN